MADPVFPREVDKNLLFGKIFVKNCIKVNAIGPKMGDGDGGCRPWRPLDARMLFMVMLCV